MSNKSFDVGSLHGITFYDAKSTCYIRYICPDASHWVAGWLVRQTKGGQWITMRKATQEDIEVINRTVTDKRLEDILR